MVSLTKTAKDSRVCPLLSSSERANVPDEIWTSVFNVLVGSF